MACKQVMDVPV